MTDLRPKLELKGVTKAYGKTKVLDNISLTVNENEFFAVLGPSGAGKSTLLKVIIGVETPDSGRIYINGTDVTDLPPNRRNVAVVFQSYALYPNMTVYQNIAFPLKMRRLTNKRIDEKVVEAAGKLGITEILHKNVTKISGGQKQRTALARALVRDPSIFLLDEPLSNLDARVRFRAREELRKLREDLKQTFVYVTHDQFEIANLANLVAVLHNGKFEQISSFSELYDHPATDWVGDFIGNYPMNFLPAHLIGLGEGADCQVGFRAEWVEIADSGFKCTVMSAETVGDLNYLYCTVGENHFIVKHDRYIEPGSDANFRVMRYNTYRNGRLEGKDIAGTAAPSGSA